MEVDDGGHAFMVACIDVHGSHIHSCISLLLKSISETVILGFQRPVCSVRLWQIVTINRPFPVAGFVNPLTLDQLICLHKRLDQLI